MFINLNDDTFLQPRLCQIEIKVKSGILFNIILNFKFRKKVDSSLQPRLNKIEIKINLFKPFDPLWLSSGHCCAQCWKYQNVGKKQLTSISNLFNSGCSDKFAITIKRIIYIQSDNWLTRNNK